MSVMSIETKLCISCMEEHEVQQIEILEENIFKGKRVQYPAKYEYCPNTDLYTATNKMMDENDVSLKDVYRESMGFLTSKEIKAIREKYGVSQKDFSKILGWGAATITRYENHQVQDSAHDDILRKVSEDPKWFIDLLKRSKDKLSEKAYNKYLKKASEEYYVNRNGYLKNSLEASYARFEGDSSFTGNQQLNVSKAVEVINYLALKVKELHKVKLMKMLWYIDFLNYKKEKKSITGLVYSALPMGAVPEGHEALLQLEGINYNEMQYNENIGYKFYPAPGFHVKELSNSEIETIDEVIRHFQDSSANEIVERMHQEEAYKKTELFQPISYEHAENLSI